MSVFASMTTLVWLNIRVYSVLFGSNTQPLTYTDTEIVCSGASFVKQAFNIAFKLHSIDSSLFSEINVKNVFSFNHILWTTNNESKTTNNKSVHEIYGILHLPTQRANNIICSGQK
jgi:hypothetical protein